jgi:CRP-like cAMP-binding protein
MAHEWSHDSAKAGRVRAAKGRPIFEQGGPAHPAYVIEEGCVSVSTTASDGRRVVVTFLFSGDTLCAGVHDTWASAVAVTDCVLSSIPVAQATVRAGGSLLDASDDLLHEVVTRVALLAHLDAPDQVRWFFHWLADRTGRLAGQTVAMPMSRRDVADFLGIAPETVSRAMHALEQRGELRRQGLHLCQLNPGRRREPSLAVGGCAGSMQACAPPR